jgi:hypothetical protein
MAKWLITQQIKKTIIVEAKNEAEAIHKAFSHPKWNEEPTTQVEAVEEDDNS